MSINRESVRCLGQNYRRTKSIQAAPIEVTRPSKFRENKVTASWQVAACLFAFNSLPANFAMAALPFHPDRSILGNSIFLITGCGRDLQGGKGQAKLHTLGKPWGNKEVPVGSIHPKTKCPVLNGIKDLDLENPHTWPNISISRFYGVDSISAKRWNPWYSLL